MTALHSHKAHDFKKILYIEFECPEGSSCDHFKAHDFEKISYIEFWHSLLGHHIMLVWTLRRKLFIIRIDNWDNKQKFTSPLTNKGDVMKKYVCFKK